MATNTYTWSGATNTDWNTASNWINGGTVSAGVPNDPTAIAIVDTGTRDVIISNNATDAIGDLTISGQGHVIVGGGPSIGGGGGGTLTATGTITVTSTNSGGGLVGGPAGVINAPAMAVGKGAIIGGGGLFNAATLVNDGIIQADGANYALGALSLGGNLISGGGSIEVDGPSTVILGAATAQPMLVATGATDTATVILNAPSSFTGSLNLFNANTHLNLAFNDATGRLLSYDGKSVFAGGKSIAVTSNGTPSLMLTGGTGNDTIFGGANGVPSIAGSGGTNFLIGDNSGGSTTIVSTGTRDLVDILDGGASVTSAGNGASIFMNGPGTLTAALGGSAPTVVGGAGAATITASKDALVFGGKGELTFVGGAGAATVVGGSGAFENVSAGSGGLLLGTNANSFTTVQGAGTSTIFGASGGAVYIGKGAGNAVLAAGAGNETLNASGSSGRNIFFGSSDKSGTLRVAGGTGEDTILAGAGSVTMTGGSGGGDWFVLTKSATAGAHNYITDFFGTDVAFMTGYGGGQTAAGLLSAAKVDSSGVTLTLNDNTQLTFTNLTSASQLTNHILYT